MTEKSPRNDLSWSQILRILSLLGGIVFMCLTASCVGAAIWSHFIQAA
jgi:hypothetical protein